MDSMFLALRDLRFARGRFALIGGVIALLTFMVVMLSGLTAGLGAASISAVRALPVDRIAFQQPAAGQGPSFTTSTLPTGTVSRLTGMPGVTAAHPLGITTTQLLDGNAATAVSLLGTDAALLPAVRTGRLPGSGEVAITETVARDQHLAVGDRIGIAGADVAVAGVVDDTSLGHLPVVYTDIATWQRLAHADTITAVAITGSPEGPAAGITVVDRTSAFDAVAGYTSEQGSLNLMRILLVVVSALVVGTFFTVWTMQRAGDLAVIRAIGGSRRYLLRDALGQALFVLLVGAVVGAAAAVGVGLAAATVVPFELGLATVGLPLAAMLGVGLIGAAASVRRIGTVDPLTALGASR
jgi:putative ABC transport system permease protein